jgi:hypothetical protein
MSSPPYSQMEANHVHFYSHGDGGNLPLTSGSEGVAEAEALRLLSDPRTSRQYVTLLIRNLTWSRRSARFPSRFSVPWR